MSKEEFNDVVNFAQEERDLMRERAYVVMKQGVKIRDPDRFDLRGELICGRNVDIDINVGRPIQRIHHENIFSSFVLRDNDRMFHFFGGDSTYCSRFLHDVNKG